MERPEENYPEDNPKSGSVCSKHLIKQFLGLEVTVNLKYITSTTNFRTIYSFDHIYMYIIEVHD